MTDQKPYKRSVFFIGGMLPVGKRFYNTTLKREARRHGELYDRNVSVKESADYKGMRQAEIRSTCPKSYGERDCITHYRTMDWGDLQAKWKQENFITILFLTYLEIIKTFLVGDIFRFYAHYWGFGNGILLLAIMPIIFIIAVPWLTLTGLGYLGLPVYLDWALTVVIFIGFMWALGAGKKDRLALRSIFELIRIRRDYANGSRKDLDKRLDEFAALLKQSLLEEDCDELLVVGHSFGCLLGVEVIARAQKGLDVDKIKPKNFSFLTCGSVHHYVAIIKKAQRYRDALAVTGALPYLYWLEPSLPQDGMNFPKRNAVEDFTNIKPVSGPHKKSVKYGELVSKETYKKLYRDFWKMHFQYLKEGEYQGDYSFYRMIASSQPLQENYGLREKPIEGRAKEA